MEIFKKLLLPISSEFFPENAVNRIAKFMEKFNSRLVVAYIIEEKTLKKMEEVSEVFLTEEQMEEMENQILEQGSMVAEKIIFEKVEPFIHEFGKKVIFGEFSEEVKKISREQNITCIITGYEKNCFLRYRLFEEMNIPIWVEMGRGNKIVLGICSNLAPNKRVPSLTLEIAKAFGYTPHLLYVVDKEERVEVDEKGRKIERNIEELVGKAKKFLQKYEDKAITHFAKGILEEEIVEYANSINADVVILGREMKKRKIFCREMKKNIVEKLKHSMFFLN
ncbi:MAG: universal stress protein [Thermoplasmata archaeon]|nr:MAG: universal stress protein [Thermoplasmata archaeon]